MQADKTKTEWQTAVQKGKAMITDRQRIQRMKSLGSSDAPAVLGVCPWRSGYDLWLQKTNQVPPTEENPKMRLGTILEAPLLKLAGERLGLKVVKPTSSFVGCYPFFKANIDGMVNQAKRGADIVEIKTTGSTDGWGAQHTDEIPEAVKVQVAFQMSCSSSHTAHVAVLSGLFGLEFKVYTVQYDSDYCGYVMARCEEWWRNHIEGGRPPKDNGSLKMLTQIKRNELTVNLPQGLFQAERDAKDALKVAEEKYEAAKCALVTALGRNKKGIGETHTVSVVEVQAEKFDRKAFAAEHPAMDKEYTVPSFYNRIDVRNINQKRAEA